MWPELTKHMTALSKILEATGPYPLWSIPFVGCTLWGPYPLWSLTIVILREALKKKSQKVEKVQKGGGSAPKIKKSTFQSYSLPIPTLILQIGPIINSTLQV